jgi:hypothetical protein
MASMSRVAFIAGIDFSVPSLPAGAAAAGASVATSARTRRGALRRAGAARHDAAGALAPIRACERARAMLLEIG